MYFSFFILCDHSSHDQVGVVLHDWIYLPPYSLWPCVVYFQVEQNYITISFIYNCTIVQCHCLSFASASPLSCCVSHTLPPSLPSSLFLMLFVSMPAFLYPPLYLSHFLRILLPPLSFPPHALIPFLSSSSFPSSLLPSVISLFLPPPFFITL